MNKIRLIQWKQIINRFAQEIVLTGRRIVLRRGRRTMTIVTLTL